MPDLFDQLLTEGEAGIDRLIQERTQETVQLDFKAKRDPSRGRFDDDDKRVFGKALSAFANSAGGLLIWGVDARKGPDGVDCAQEPAIPIAEIERFQSEATRWAGELLIPRHDGVRVERINSERQPGAGYLLVSVARSERRPHRCEAKDVKQYFKRAGDSTFAMEHYDIEDAFSRISVPSLDVRFISLHGGQGLHDVNQYYFLFSIELMNTSDHIAKFPFIMFQNMHGMGIHQNSYYQPPYKAYINRQYGSLTGGADDVIHPGTQVVVGQFIVLFQRPAPQQLTWSMMDERSQRDGPSFDYLFGCEGMRGERGSWQGERSQFRLPR